MQKYLKVSKEYFVPSVKNQNAKFDLGLIINETDINFVKDFLGLDFIAFNDMNEFIKFSNKYEIQTRHDIDDWFRDDYISEIQNQWNKSNKNKLLIQSLPIKNDIRSNSIIYLKNYNDKRISMHLSLCQNNPVNHIMKYKHGEMWKVTNNIIALNHGFTKWIIHGDNISLNRIKK